MTLVDNQNRSTLSEGRNWGIGFAFCKREGDTLTTVQPISPCKDYLSDVVYSEHTGKPYRAHGLSTERRGIFGGGAAFIVMGIMPYNHGTTKAPGHGELEKSLVAPETGLIPFLTHFEAKLGITPTRIEIVAPERALATLDLFWVKYPYLISLWSLLVRVGLKYREGDPMEFLGRVSDGDAYLVKAVVPKLKLLLAGEVPVQDMTKSYDVHNTGIYTFPFPSPPST